MKGKDRVDVPISQGLKDGLAFLLDPIKSRRRWASECLSPAVILYQL